MGERVIVRFEDAQGVVCGIYLHWHGGEARDWLIAAAPTLRKGDASYAAARFCGDSEAEFQDHGMLVVDCYTGLARHIYGGAGPDMVFSIDMGAE